jgi:NDP-sugar pyrophosphorylase family protein
MKAMIFAAGLGTRLKPVTEKIPKALVEVGGIPMIERVIKNLKSAGVDEIIINLHHFPEMITAFIQQENHFGIKIQFSDETGQLLETGGGLMKAANFFDDNQPFIVHNADVLTDLNLNSMIDFHLKNSPVATLFVQKRKTSRYLEFNPAMQLCGWKNTKTGEQITARVSAKKSDFAFNGIHIIEPKIFKLITQTGKFSIIPAYLELAKNHAIKGYTDEKASFIDIGKPENLEEADRRFG